MPADPSHGELIRAAALAKQDLERQKAAAKKLGSLNGRVTIFVGRTSHTLPEGAIRAGDLKMKLRLPEGARLLLEDVPVADDVMIPLAGGEGFSWSVNC